jgi:hypothetical protein
MQFCWINVTNCALFTGLFILLVYKAVCVQSLGIPQIGGTFCMVVCFQVLAIQIFMRLPNIYRSGFFSKIFGNLAAKNEWKCTVIITI